jgi:hypothetical protein
MFRRKKKKEKEKEVVSLAPATNEDVSPPAAAVVVPPDSISLAAFTDSIAVVIERQRIATKNDTADRTNTESEKVRGEEAAEREKVRAHMTQEAAATAERYASEARRIREDNATEREKDRTASENQVNQLQF